MDTDEYVAMIESDLWPQICDFYHLRIDYNHPSWTSNLFLKYVDKDIIKKFPALAGIWILRKLKMNSRFSIPVKHPLTKLILADHNKFCEVVKYCGLARYHFIIRGSLSGASQQYYSDILGEKEYHFVINTAPLLLSSWNKLPELEYHLTKDKQEFLANIYIAGIQTIILALDDLNIQITQLIKFKVPINFRILFTNQQRKITKDKKTLLLFINKIIRIVEPKCENSL